MYLLCVTCVIITVLNNLKQDGTNRIGNVVQNSTSFMKLCSSQLSSEDSYLGKDISRDDMAAPVPLSQEQFCSVTETWHKAESRGVHQWSHLQDRYKIHMLTPYGADFLLMRPTLSHPCSWK